MMQLLRAFLVSLVLTVAFSSSHSSNSESLVDYVNVLGGSASNYGLSSGSTLPLVTRPWGFAAWAPQSNDPNVNGGGSAQWWFAPNERRFFGIRCTRQPSPWINDYGNFLINAYVPGKYNQHKNEAKYPSGYLPSKSTFKPYLFETELIAYKSLAGDATMSVSAARHSAMIAARFPAPDKLVGEYTDASRRISVALEGESNDAAEVVRADPEFKTVVIKGWSTHNTGGIADPASFKNHFVAAIFTGERGDEPVEALTSSVGVSTEWAWADFDQDRFSDFTVRVGVSFISEEQARRNLRQELDGLSFPELVEQAKEEWEAQLQKTRLEEVGGNNNPPQHEQEHVYSEEEERAAKSLFYTAAFRAALFPRQISEIDASGKEVHWSPYSATGEVHDGPLTSDSGFWDAYNTVYPLASLINLDILGPKMLTGWLNAYRESGWLPKWASPGHRDSMTSTMADATFADAIINRVPGFDVDLAYEAIRKDAFVVPDQDNVGRPCLQPYVDKGYVPHGSMDSVGNVCDQTVSRSLLYMQSDAAVATAATFLGKTEDSSVLAARAGNYSLLFDQETGFFRPREHDSGKFVVPFDEFAWGGDYTEAGPWQYRFFVPHDPQGLRDLYKVGGRSLGETIVTAQEMPGIFHVGDYDNEIHEQTEGIYCGWGQYGHDNQPSHYMLWMLAAIEESPAYAAKGQYYLRRAVTELYKDDVEMFAGDEDNGEMASWFLLASAGLYSLSPGAGTKFRLGSPLYKKMSLALGEGKTLTVKAANNGPKNVYVHSARLNGRELADGVVEYRDLMQGGELVFEMSDMPKL